MSRARAALWTMLCALGLFGLGLTGCKVETVVAPDMSINDHDLDSTPSCEAMKCQNPDAKCCNGEPCVDLTANSQNCGACGKVCRTREMCTGGVCACPGGGHTGACATSDTCCGDGCHSTMTDLKNCGGCSLSCKDGEACLSGKCSCGPAGKTCTGSQACCSTGCADFQTDANNCGKCGKVCMAGHACKSGACEGECLPCNLGETCCNGICANLFTDANNCKTCGHQCLWLGKPTLCTLGNCWFAPPPDGGAADMSLPHD